MGADGECGGVVVEAAESRETGGLPETQFEAPGAPRAALRLVFQSGGRPEKGAMVVRGDLKSDRMGIIGAGQKELHGVGPARILLRRVHIRVVVEQRDPEIPGQILQHVAAAGAAAAVEEQGGDLPGLPVLLDDSVHLPLIVFFHRNSLRTEKPAMGHMAGSAFTD